jgi:filamentous hemagglutinin
MVGLGILTAGGLPAISMMGSGAAIGGSVNAGAQYVISGSVDWKDVAIGAGTGAVTIGAPFVPGLLVNTGGALMGSALKGENPNGNIAGAAIGTAVGYPVGVRIDSTLNRTLNPWYRSQWTELGLGISAFVPKSPIPWIFGTTGSSAVQEITGDSTKQHIQGKR